MARNFHNKGDDPAKKVKHSLELDEDIKMHLIGWKIQQIGWGLMALFFMLGAIGLFGSGFISNRSIRSNNIIVEYEHFGRYEANTKIVVLFPSDTLSIISIPQLYLNQIKLHQVLPEPKEIKMEKGNYIMSFAGLREGRITLYLLPQTTGSVQSTIYINDHPYSINQFIYP
jgi:hypothetical protein